VFRFHWSVSQTEILDASLCRQAELCGIESVAIPVDFSCPDPLDGVLRLGREADSMRFMLSFRSVPSSVELYVDANRSLWSRLCHELSRDCKERLLAQFDAEDLPLDALRGFLSEYDRLQPQGMPEILLSGDSTEAVELGIRYASFIWQSPCAEELVPGKAGPLFHFGVGVGFSCFLIARKTREDAIEAVRELRAAFDGHEPSAQNAVEPVPGFWCGWNPVPDAPPVALFGSYEEVARTIARYRRCGVAQFQFMGWPARDEMRHFSDGVLPLLPA